MDQRTELNDHDHKPRNDKMDDEDDDDDDDDDDGQC